MITKIVNYNIQYGVGQDGVYNLQRIIDTLKGQDIICLQEVTTHWHSCEYDHQPDVFAKALNLFTAYAPGFEVDSSHLDVAGKVVNQRRAFGNMVLSKWPIAYSRCYSLPRPSTVVPQEFFPRIDIPRSVLETVIDVNGCPIRVITTHLSHLPGKQRQSQVAVLNSLCESLPTEAPLWSDDPILSTWTEGISAPPIPGMTLLMGDFNFEPNETEYRQMTSGDGSFVDAWSMVHKTADRPVTCIEPNGNRLKLDYLFLSENAKKKIRSFFVDQDNISSDHFPLFFEFEL